MDAHLYGRRSKLSLTTWDESIGSTSPGIVVYASVAADSIEKSSWWLDQESRRYSVEKNNFRVRATIALLSGLIGSGSTCTLAGVYMEEASDRGEHIEFQSGERDLKVRAAVKTRMTFDDHRLDETDAFSNDVVEIAHTIAEIRNSLSLSMTDLALILGVQRPTIYAWMRRDASPQNRNLEKLKFIFQVAQKWSSMSTRPLERQLRFAFNKNNKSLLDLLKDEGTLMTEVDRHLQSLLKIPEPERLRSIREIAMNHGLNTVSHVDADLVREIESGKRLTRD